MVTDKDCIDYVEKELLSAHFNLKQAERRNDTASVYYILKRIALLKRIVAKLKLNSK